MDNIILDCYFLCSLNHYKVVVMYFFFPIFIKTLQTIHNSMGMGHGPKIMEKIPENRVVEPMLVVIFNYYNYIRNKTI